MGPRTPGDGTSFHTLSTDELLRLVRDGRGALLELVTRFAGELQRANAGRPAGPVRPSDVAGGWYEKFLERCHKLLPAFENEVSFRAYLRTAAENQYRKDAGTAQRQPTLPAEEGRERVDPVTPSERVRSAEDAAQRAREEEALRRCVDALDESDRLLYRLRHQRGWSHRKLAELLFGDRGERYRLRVIRRLDRIAGRLDELIWGQGGIPEGPGHERNGSAGA